MCWPGRSSNNVPISLFWIPTSSISHLYGWILISFSLESLAFAMRPISMTLYGVMRLVPSGGIDSLCGSLISP